MNKVILSGRLTRDVELKKVGSKNTSMAIVSLAVQNLDDVYFIESVAFGKLAETMNEYCTKGKSIIISGRLSIASYTDRNGEKHNKLGITIESFEFQLSQPKQNAD